MPVYVVRVWLPDRPGALGQVASRIGGVRGDVVGIEILERGAGRAVDDLVVALPSEDLLDLLVAEIGQVDDVAVENVRRVTAEPAEHGVMALGIAAQLVGEHPDRRLELLCSEIVELLEAEWAIAVGFDPCTVVSHFGEAPDLGWLLAFLDGIAHLSPGDVGAHTPPDVVWTHMPRRGAAVAAGRPQRAFRGKERQQVELLGRITDGLAG